MPEKFTVEIISPDGTVLKSETSEVIIPSYEGEIGILKEHIPLITFLRPGIIKIKDNEEKSFFVEEGTVEFVSNSLIVLTTTAKELTDIDIRMTMMREQQDALEQDMAPFGFVVTGLEDENIGEMVDEYGTKWSPVVRDYRDNW